MHERPIRQLSIDRSSSAAGSVSISNWFINLLEAGGDAQLRRAPGDSQGDERYVTNVLGRGYCCLAPVDCAASSCIQHLYG